MIVSHRHKFIFIKTFKTASTSLEIALSEYCGPKDIITPISDKDENLRVKFGYPGSQNYRIPLRKYSKLAILQHLYWFRPKLFYNHMPGVEIRNAVDSDVWNNYFKFTFERNPYDKTVSKYFWVKQFRSFNNIKEFILSGRASRTTGFDLYSEHSMPIVDKVYKYENMKEALSDITVNLGLNKPLQLPKKRTKGTNRKDKRHYREILNEEEKSLISHIYAREIAYWNYEF